MVEVVGVTERESGGGEGLRLKCAVASQSRRQ